MAEEQDPPVGYASPPKHSQFKKGCSHPRRRSKKNQTIDIVALISENWKLGEGRGAKKIHPFELALQQLCKKAMKGDMRAAQTVLKYFYQYGLIAAETTHLAWPSRLEVPYDHDYDDWMNKLAKHGPPPWNYEHDGISRLQELRDAHRA